MKIELNANRTRQGWEVTAWEGEVFKGRCLYLFSTKKEALATARETVEREEGLGIFRKSFA